MPFPDQFLWGVAAAAYQVEGAADREGRSPSVWDAFCAQPGNVFHGHSGREACDHYRRYTEDAALMSDLGVGAYRLSLSWSRILPDGTGAANAEGLDFYDRLVDALLARDIQPWVTLFHWDLPVCLQQRGGWLNRESIDWFAAYARVAAERLGDRVQHWMTFNEPQIFLGLGYREGNHAPGLRLARPDLLRAAHHVLCAHGKASQNLRSASPGPVQIGWAPHSSVPYPADTEPASVEAAERAMFAVPPDDQWVFSTSWFADPVILGGYPEDGLQHFGHELPTGFEADLEQIAQPLDFFGVNIYQGRTVRPTPDGGTEDVPRKPGFPHTMFYWPIDPQVLYWGPRFLWNRYQRPLYITENGCASMDWVHCDGCVHDAPRIDFLTRHLLALRSAIADGADVRGYFQWSLLDNFEWAEGYRMRFGLIYVDYETFERIPKDSYMWYQQVILSNGGNLPDQPRPLR